MKINLSAVIILNLTIFGFIKSQPVTDGYLSKQAMQIGDTIPDSSDSRGFQQNLNLSFVHHYADFFRANAMGVHLNLGYGIKPKLKNFEIVASLAYSRIRIEENSRFYDTYNEKYLLISTIGIGYCLPVAYHRGLLELKLSMGPQAFTFIDAETIYGIFAGISIRFYFPSSKSRPDIKYGIYAEFRDHTYSMFGGDYFWDEYLKSKKEHVARDAVFLLGFIVGFGDFS